MLVIFLIISTGIKAQEASTPNIVGSNYTIDSKILNEARQIQVFLPDGYANEDHQYAVLYLLDGQRFFLPAVGLYQSFKQYKLTPGFIVVGITNSYPQRFRHFTRGAANFAKFITSEVVPFINNKFRTNDDNLLFGWEYAGSLALKIMTESSTNFKGYLLASPFPIEQRINDLDSLLQSGKQFRNHLFFGVSDAEGMVGEGTDKLAQLWKKNKGDNTNWQYLRLANEEHRSTGYPMLYHGLRNYFGNYPELQVNDLQAFLDAGGLDYANNYNQIRAEKYGFDQGFSEWTKFTIIRSAIRANSFEKFEEFLRKFYTPAFIGGLRGSRPFEIAKFYEKHNSFEKAIEIYTILEQSEVHAKPAVDDLIRLHSQLNNKKQVRKYTKKAKEMAEK